MAYDKHKMQDIRYSEKQLWQQYLSYWQNNNLTGMKQMLIDYPNLKYKVLNAFNWNRLLNLVKDGTNWTSSLNNSKIITNATTDSVAGKFASDFNSVIDASPNFKYIGIWNSATAYKKNNMVKTSDLHAYYCVADNTNQPVTNTSYWRPVILPPLPISSTAPLTMVAGDIYFEQVVT